MWKSPNFSKHTHCSFSKCEKMRSTFPRFLQLPGWLPLSTSFTFLRKPSWPPCAFPPLYHPSLLWSGLVCHCLCSHILCVSFFLSLHHYFTRAHSCACLNLHPLGQFLSLWQLHISATLLAFSWYLFSVCFSGHSVKSIRGRGLPIPGTAVSYAPSP